MERPQRSRLSRMTEPRRAANTRSRRVRGRHDRRPARHPDAATWPVARCRGRWPSDSGCRRGVPRTLGSLARRRRGRARGGPSAAGVGRRVRAGRPASAAVEAWRSRAGPPSVSGRGVGARVARGARSSPTIALGWMLRSWFLLPEPSSWSVRMCHGAPDTSPAPSRTPPAGHVPVPRLGEVATPRRGGRPSRST